MGPQEVGVGVPRVAVVLRFGLVVLDVQLRLLASVGFDGRHVFS